MPATWRQRGPRWFEVRIGSGKDRQFKNVRTEQDARDLVRIITQQERAGVDVAAAASAARVRAASRWGCLRDLLPPFIQLVTARGDWTGSTPINYARRLATHVYDFPLADGRRLGDLPVDQITTPMLGAVLDAVRSRQPDGQPGKSLAVQNQIRSPLVAFYRELRTKHGFSGANPAEDLRGYMSKNPSRRARQGVSIHFEPAEAATLFPACEVHYPRWTAFLACGILAGLRWGEAAALEIRDIDFRRGLVHVCRSFCEKTGAVKDVKDHEDRYVPLGALSPKLAGWLRAQIEWVTLEGQMQKWPTAQRALLFPNSRGRIGRHSTFLEWVWQPLLAKAGLPYRKPHAMRHTFGTWCAEGDPALDIPVVPLHTLKDWMGHASVQETERYLHASKARTGRTVDIFGGRL